MQTKLTLRLDNDLINQAKEYAALEGKSISRMVADFFSLLIHQDKTSESEFPPITRSLIGILPSPIMESDYHQYLEDKYL